MNVGVVFGVQESLKTVSMLGRYCLTLVFPEPRQFGTLIFASVASVFAASISYSIYACNALAKPEPPPTHSPVIHVSSSMRDRKFSEHAELELAEVTA